MFDLKRKEKADLDKLFPPQSAEIYKMMSHTVLVLSKLKKIIATAPQPHQTAFRYFAIFKNAAHCLKPGKTPSISASHQA